MSPVLSALLLLSVLSAAQARPGPRSLWQFRQMMVCTMPDSWPILDFADYGCYCGKGGSGSPVDDMDRCCQVHDQCYRDSKKHEECWALIDHPYMEHYYYTCDQASRTVTCTDRNDGCEMFICECDKAAADCFARSPYNPDYEHLPSDQCR